MINNKTCPVCESEAYSVYYGLIKCCNVTVHFRFDLIVGEDKFSYLRTIDGNTIDSYGTCIIDGNYVYLNTKIDDADEAYKKLLYVMNNLEFI